MPARTRRMLATVAAALLATVGLLGATSTSASAATLTTTQTQWNLAGLGYLGYADIDGAYGPTTTAAAKRFQVDRCLDADGKVAQVWKKVSVDGHDQQVLEALQELAG